MLKRNSILGVFVLQLCMLPAASAQDDQAGVENPVSYFLGLTVGRQMAQTGFELSDLKIEGLVAGFRDGIEGNDPKLTQAQLIETQTKIQSLIQARQNANKEKGVKFLAENAKKEGIKQLEGGIQVKELKAGTGPSPKPTDTVKVHYTGKLINGTKFDSSVDRGEPATFPVNRVIKGWQMAIPQMKVGSKWMIYIPSDLAYGPQGSPSGGIGPDEVLVFEVELLGIE